MVAAVAGFAARSFVARVYKVGINRCVDVPTDVVARPDDRPYLPVVVTLGGRSARTTLVPAGSGGYRLFLNNRLRLPAGVDAGDDARLRLEPDPEPVEPALPLDLESALSRARLMARFRRQSPYRRREMVRFLEGAKRAPTREKRIARILQVLETSR